MTRTEKENLVPVWERITICQHFPSESAQCTISMQTGAGKNIT